ncbi:DUF6262 family protein [Alkalihalobacillus pseudalcaliphilus]|uniref:DUF6262 family protein n=1 Tax=Alkalihalobacillus pseudalcaliphilus TaxID=79884 RepID=UPI00235EC514|nr:DUF6262 family protein [Alkalihalobacillus pseudalcaliphilus]
MNFLASTSKSSSHKVSASPIRLELSQNESKNYFNQVAMESGVSKAFLYNNQEIRNRIEGIRKQQEGLNSPQTIKMIMYMYSFDFAYCINSRG